MTERGLESVLGGKVFGLSVKEVFHCPPDSFGIGGRLKDVTEV